MLEVLLQIRGIAKGVTIRIGIATIAAMRIGIASIAAICIGIAGKLAICIAIAILQYIATTIYCNLPLSVGVRATRTLDIPLES